MRVQNSYGIDASGFPSVTPSPHPCKRAGGSPGLPCSPARAAGHPAKVHEGGFPPLQVHRFSRKEGNPTASRCPADSRPCPCPSREQRGSPSSPRPAAPCPRGGGHGDPPARAPPGKVRGGWDTALLASCLLDERLPREAPPESRGLATAPRAWRPASRAAGPGRVAATSSSREGQRCFCHGCCSPRGSGRKARGVRAPQAWEANSSRLPVPATDLCSRTLCTESRSSRFLVTGRGMLYLPAPNIAGANGPFIARPAAACPAALRSAGGRRQVGALQPARLRRTSRAVLEPAGAAPRGTGEARPTQLGTAACAAEREM